MSGKLDHPQFEMSEPVQEKRAPTRFAFWLKTEKSDLVEFLGTLKPVTVMEGQADAEGRLLVAIKDDYDADEVWHYVRQELEREADYVDLDDIWNDALWL